MNPAFALIFARLREILQKHAGKLAVAADTSDDYCLAVDHSAKLKKGFPAAWVKISKAYVSYHFMPVYMFPNCAMNCRRSYARGSKASRASISKSQTKCFSRTLTS